MWLGQVDTVTPTALRLASGVQRDPFAVVFPQTPYCAALRESRHWPELAAMMRLPSGD